MCNVINLMDELPRHQQPVEQLLEEAFGSERLKKTVYRLREGVAPVAGLSLVAEDGDGQLLGTLRFWPVRIVTAEGRKLDVLLLGPIAVHGGLRKTGVGTLLMQEGLRRAACQGWPAVLLVGDEPYYSRFGFCRRLAESLVLPGPVDLHRFLALELLPGSLEGIGGRVESMMAVQPRQTGPELFC